MVREPGETELGRGIWDLLPNVSEVADWAEFLLFLADRVQLTEEVLVPALERGEWVVSDRSVFSALAYQGGARGKGWRLIRRLAEEAGTVWPDIIVLLDMDSSVAARQTSLVASGSAISARRGVLRRLVQFGCHYPNARISTPNRTVTNANAAIIHIPATAQRSSRTTTFRCSYSAQRRFRS